MTQHFPLDYSDPVHEGFFDPIQELLGAEVNPNFILSRVNSTTIKVAAGTDNSEVAIAINGRYRYRTTETTAALPGGLPNGEHPVFVTASDNNFGGPLGDPDESTDYSFGLQIKKTGETPGTALYRQVGAVVVASGAITALKQTAGRTTGAQLADGALVDSAQIAWTRNADGALVAALVAAVSEALIPTGTLLATARATAPTGFVLADGSAISRTTFAALFAAIGTTFGVGNGSSTFNIPDLRGRVPVGVDGAAARLAANDALGQSGGAETVALITANLPSHTHGVGSLHTRIDVQEAFQRFANSSGQTFGAPGFQAIPNWGNWGNQIDGETAAAGSGTAHANLQPYQVVNWMIKT